MPHQQTASYADRAWQGTVTIGENAAVARDTYRLRLACPQIARTILPGQFLMLRLPNSNDPLLGRPLALAWQRLQPHRPRRPLEQVTVLGLSTPRNFSDPWSLGPVRSFTKDRAGLFL